MDMQTTKKWAKSLTAESTDLLPFLPYLLQDLWQLGGSVEIIDGLVARHAEDTKKLDVLDLACGKGAVSILLAQKHGCRVTGVDLMPEFIEEARDKAAEYGVQDLCRFFVQDINHTVEEESGYDCVIFSAAGDVLGKPPELLGKLKKTVGPGGMVVLDESYLKPNGDSNVKFLNYAYYTEEQWNKLFDMARFTVLEKVLVTEQEIGEGMDHDLQRIEARAHELMEQYPDKKRLFEQYIKSQVSEGEDILLRLMNAVWLLKAN